MNHKVFEKTVLAAIILVSVAFILPLLGISFCNHPSADDFTYSNLTHQAWQQTHSLAAVLVAAAKTSANYWHTWQGLYSSAFLLSLQPSIFGESWYSLAAVFIILSLCGSVCFFSWYVLRKKLGMARLESAAFAFAALLLMLQWMPSPLQGLYWFNGAGNYSFFFAVLLVLAVGIISLNTPRKAWVFALKVAATSAVAFVLSGGNHVTAFAGLLLLAAALAFALAGKKTRWFLSLLAPFAAAAAGFILNAKAPGTAVRQANYAGSRLGFAKTVALATFRGFENSSNWLNLAMPAVLLLLLPFVVRCVKRLLKNGYRFKRPLLVLALSAAFPCLLFCPPFYAMGHEGAGRLLNVVYFSLVVLLFVNEFYITGWVCSKFAFSYAENSARPPAWCKEALACALAACMFAACLRPMCGYQALQILANGRAREYHRQQNARAEVLRHSAGKDAVVEPLTIWPALLFWEDMTDDSGFWINVGTAAFYGANSVRVRSGE